ncbi:hypothetical protein [Parapedobacter sp.]|uniref:hypothetical protein n=1 Tax=Parapedobacter sp. TaxID=1958893 RepID=UPI002D80FF14|nr:hypothetical protein [Parapedobacter sp.]
MGTSIPYDGYAIYLLSLAETVTRMPEIKIIKEEVQANSEDTYYLRYIARWRFALVFLLLVFGLIGILWFLRQHGVFPASEWVGFGLVMLSLGFSFYFSRRIAIAHVAISLDEEGAHQAWLRQFAFASNPDITIRWTDIVDYKFELEPRNHRFRATLRDGTVWRFNRDLYSIKKDDFSAFSVAFNKKVEQYNLANADKGAGIRRAKTFPETHAAYVLAKLISVLILAFPIVLVILALNDSPATALVGIFGALAFVPAFLFAYMVHLNRKERDHNVH